MQGKQKIVSYKNKVINRIIPAPVPLTETWLDAIGAEGWSLTTIHEGNCIFSRMTNWEVEYQYQEEKIDGTRSIYK